jgi:hypothetical protein
VKGGRTVSLLRDTDQLLRGTFTRKEDLAEGRIEIPLRTLVVAGLILGAIYGVFMGLYGAMRKTNPSTEQLFATVVKVPLLFLLTLVVTFPSLYVFSALANSKLRLMETLRLLLAAVAVNLALLASFGPVTGFFTLSTESYSFMQVLNVFFFAVSGAVGLGFLWRALSAVFPVEMEPVPEPPPRPEPAEAREGTLPPPPPLRPPAPRRKPNMQRRIFTVWILMYAVVGAQMSWILRPFIGSPHLEFEWFRVRESNFFESLLRSIGNLF